MSAVTGQRFTALWLRSGRGNVGTRHSEQYERTHRAEGWPGWTGPL